jgi:hypothetical protein
MVRYPGALPAPAILPVPPVHARVPVPFCSTANVVCRPAVSSYQATSYPWPKLSVPASDETIDAM